MAFCCRIYLYFEKNKDTMNRPNSYNSIDAEEEIVISGIAGRFPNSDNLKEFQENLFNKVDLGSSDHRRWNNCNNFFLLILSYIYF